MEDGERVVEIRAQHSGIGEDVTAMVTAQKAFDEGYPKTVLRGRVEPGVQDINANWNKALAGN